MSKVAAKQLAHPHLCTTMIGGGLGPVTVGICFSGTVNLARMLQAVEAFPLNFGFLGKGSA